MQSSSAYAELLLDSSEAARHEQSASPQAAQAMGGSPMTAMTPISPPGGRISYAQLDLDNMQQMMLNLRAGGAPDMTPVSSAARLTPEVAGAGRAPADVQSAIVEEAAVPTGYAMLDLDKTLALAQTRNASKESTVSLGGGNHGLGLERVRQRMCPSRYLTRCSWLWLSPFAAGPDQQTEAPHPPLWPAAIIFNVT